MWRFLLIFCCCGLLLGCVERSSKLQEEVKASDVITFKDNFTIRGKTIPLPPGEWKIISSGYDSEKFFEVYFIQEHPGKKISCIFLAVDSIELNREGGYSKNKDIDRLDMHYKVVNKTTASDEQDWWYVNNFIITAIPKEGRPVRNEAIKYIKSHGYVISPDYIQVHHRLTGKHPYKKRYLHVEYYYNPEAAGFPSGSTTEWATSGWNATRINTDQRKVQYVNDLVKEHTLLHEKLKAGFHPN